MYLLRCTVQLIAELFTTVMQDRGHIDLLQQSITSELQAPSAACCSTLPSLSILFPADAVHQDASAFSRGGSRTAPDTYKVPVIHVCEHNTQFVCELW